jgi:CheY-like chemotaxis protein
MKSLRRTAKRILIVDDDADTREGLSLAIEAAGYSVHTARDGIEALKMLRHYRPDVILLDLVMPTMDGWTFRMQQLRDPELADIPVVVLAGRHEAMDRSSPRLGSAPKGRDVLDLVGEVLELLEEGAAA